MLHNKCEICTLEKLQIKAKTKQHKERKKKKRRKTRMRQPNLILLLYATCSIIKTSQGWSLSLSKVQTDEFIA